jgi:hypothetical protein
VHLAEVRFRVFPRGLGPLRADPLGTLAEGVEEEFGPKVVLAARFVSGPDRKKAVRLLVDAQERIFDDPGMGRTMRVALRILTGRPALPLDAAGWRRWWAAHGEAVYAALDAEEKREGSGPGAGGSVPEETDTE